MLKRLGDPPRSGQRYRLRSGVYAILPLNGRLLLTHQAEPDDEVQLPGGGIDPGEHPIAALHREVYEETGWRIGPPRRLTAYRRFVYMPEYDMWAEKLCTIYTARPIRRLGPPSEAGHTALFLPAHLGPDALGSPGDRHILDQWLRGR